LAMKPIHKLFSIVGLVAVIALGATAQSGAAGPTSRKIFVEGTNQSPAWMVRIEVDKADRVYHVDVDHDKCDLLKIKLRSEKDGYLYLFNIDPDGAIECYFPNKFQADNQIKANTDIEVGTGKDFVLRVGAP